MLLTIRVENFDTKNGAATVSAHTYTLNMLIYTFTPDTHGSAHKTGRIEPKHFDEMLTNAQNFKNGYCGQDEQLATDLLIALISFAKREQQAIVWKPAR